MQAPAGAPVDIVAVRAFGVLVTAANRVRASAVRRGDANRVPGDAAPPTRRSEVELLRADEEARRLDEGRRLAEEEARRREEGLQLAEEEARRLDKEVRLAGEEGRRLDSDHMRAALDARLAVAELQGPALEARRRVAVLQGPAFEARRRVAVLQRTALGAGKDHRKLVLQWRIFRQAFESYLSTLDPRDVRALAERIIAEVHQTSPSAWSTYGAPDTLIRASGAGRSERITLPQGGGPTPDMMQQYREDIGGPYDEWGDPARVKVHDDPESATFWLAKRRPAVVFDGVQGVEDSSGTRPPRRGPAAIAWPAAYPAGAGSPSVGPPRRPMGDQRPPARATVSSPQLRETVIYRPRPNPDPGGLPRPDPAPLLNLPMPDQSAFPDSEEDEGEEGKRGPAPGPDQPNPRLVIRKFLLGPGGIMPVSSRDGDDADP